MAKDDPFLLDQVGLDVQGEIAAERNNSPAAHTDALTSVTSGCMASNSSCSFSARSGGALLSSSSSSSSSSALGRRRQIRPRRIRSGSRRSWPAVRAAADRATARGHSEQRTRHFQHALQRLDALVAVGDAELIDQEDAVERMNAAEDEQRFPASAWRGASTA